MKYLLLMLVVVCLNPIHIQADKLPEVKVLSVVESIQYYAQLYNAPVDQLLTVSKCESSYNPKAVGDNGLAKNVFQYHKETFYSFAKLFGEELDYNSYNDQSKVTAYIWANYPQYKNHWTCYTKFY